jgi:hypothetical protein
VDLLGYFQLLLIRLFWTVWQRDITYDKLVHAAGLVDLTMATLRSHRSAQKYCTLTSPHGMLLRIAEGPKIKLHSFIQTTLCIKA